MFEEKCNQGITPASNSDTAVAAPPALGSDFAALSLDSTFQMSTVKPFSAKFDQVLSGGKISFGDNFSSAELNSCLTENASVVSTIGGGGSANVVAETAIVLLPQFISRCYMQFEVSDAQLTEHSSVRSSIANETLSDIISFGLCILPKEFLLSQSEIRLNNLKIVGPTGLGNFIFGPLGAPNSWGVSPKSRPIKKGGGVREFAVGDIVTLLVDFIGSQVFFEYRYQLFSTHSLTHSTHSLTHSLTH